MGRPSIISAATGLEIFANDEEAPAKVGVNFHAMNAEYLFKDPKMLTAVIECYINVFGSADIWSEFAICFDCNHLHSIEYVQENGMKCEKCGKDTKEMYPHELLKNRIKDEADNSVRLAQIVYVTDLDNPEEVIAYMWGFVDTADKIGENIIEARYANNKPYGEMVAKALREALLLNGHGADEKIYYIVETGIKTEFRKGPMLFTNMVRKMFSYAYNEIGETPVLFWTGEQSAMVTLAELHEYDRILHIPGEPNLYFFLGPMEHMLKIYQNHSPKELAEILGAIARYQKTKFFRAFLISEKRWDM